MNNPGILGALLCCLLASSLAKELPKSGSDPVPTQRGLDQTRLPRNTVAYVGQNVTFSCWAAPGTTPRIQWFEFATTSNGQLISDGGLVLPGHPDASRYSVNTTTPLQYDLTIHAVELDDGAAYVCVDASAPSSQKQRESAELIVLSGPQTCTSTLPPNDGATIEGTYYTFECTTDYGGNIAPSKRWVGPEPFGQAQSDNGFRVWSGLSFYAHRTMIGDRWQSTSNFTDSFLPVPPDTATNVPDYVDVFNTPRLEVNWPPQGMYADPVKPLNEYRVGDTLECIADAFPTAEYEWHNTRLNIRIPGAIFTIPQEWEGFSNPMRCDAANVINGFRFNRELYVDVDVPVPPTTPTTTPPTTTTPAPAEAPCNNLEGRWESIRPLKAIMCIEVDGATGAIHGVIRNDTDTYWIDLVGQTNLDGFDHLSVTGIWAENRAVSTFIGECSNCYGHEHLIVSAISRSKGGPPCGSPGQIFYSQEYEFERNPLLNCPPITIPTSG